jgi:hypothetical protein
MQIRKIIFAYALMMSVISSNINSIELIAEYVSTERQDEGPLAEALKKVVNFCLPKPEELVPLVPNKTYLEIPTPKIPDIIEKNLCITRQGLVRTGIAALATIYRFNKIRKGILKRNKVSAKTAIVQVSKEWAYDIAKAQVVDKMRALLEHYKCMPAFLRDTPENRAKSLLVKIPCCLINKGIDAGLDFTADCLYELAVKAVTGK